MEVVLSFFKTKWNLISEIIGRNQKWKTIVNQ